MRKYIDLVKNILLFLISSFIPKAISFFLVPIYTCYLSTKEFGISDLINTTVALLLPIVTLNIKDAVLRFSINDNYDNKDVFSSFCIIQLLGIFFVFIISVLQYYFNILNIPFVYVIFFDILLISTSIYDNFCSFSKGIGKVKVIVEASVLNSIITVFLNIFLIVVLKMGLYGFLIANCVGYIFTNILFFIRIKAWKFINFEFNKTVMKKMIMYSFPLVFSAIAWWVNNASDRYVISLICGVSISGIYAVSTKIPSILTTFQSVFMQAWSISAIKDFDKKDSDAFIGNMYSILNFLLFSCCSILIIFNLVISKVLFKKEFFLAWKYVPFLLISVAIDGMALFICNLFFAINDTKSRAIVTICGAIINTILNFVLIYYFDAFGAAIATLVGYFTGFCVSRYIAKKSFYINTNMKKNDLIIFIVFIQSILAYFGNRFIILQILLFCTIIMFNIDKIKKILNTFLKKTHKETM